MQPLECVSCGVKLKEINSDNYSYVNKSRCSEKDNPLYRDCEKKWQILKNTVEDVFNILFKSPQMDGLDYWHQIHNNLDSLLAAYTLLTEYFEGDESGIL